MRFREAVRRIVTMLGLHAILVVPLLDPSVASGAAPRGAPAAHAESLYAEGRFVEAEQAYRNVPLRSAADTLAGLRRAALRLWRDDREGARQELDAVDRIRPGLRSSRALRAESWMRDDSCAQAAALLRANGREAKAAQVGSFAGLARYEILGDSTTVVPFAQTDPLPVISVEVGDRGPRWFLIDTGGGETVLDPQFADSIGLTRFGEETGTFGGGKRSAVVLSRVDRLRLGGITVRSVPVGLLDLSHFARIAGGRPVSGIIGTHVLMRFRATLDYPGRRLILERRARRGESGAGPGGAPDSSRVDVPIWLTGDHLILARGRFAKGPDALWFVDTGLAGAAVTAPASTLEEAGIPVPDTTSGGVGQGGGGAVRIKMFGVPSFALGEVRSGALLGVFGAFPPTLERGQGYRIAGIISHAFFRSWRVTFDFDRMTLRMERPRQG